MRIKILDSPFIVYPVQTGPLAFLLMNLLKASTHAGNHMSKKLTSCQKKPTRLVSKLISEFIDSIYIDAIYN